MASRAFLYELSLSRSNAGRDVRRNARSIRIVSLQMAGEKRIYRTTEPINQPEVPAEKAPEIYLLRGGEAAAFPAASAANQFLVGVEVDAPWMRSPFATVMMLWKSASPGPGLLPSDALLTATRACVDRQDCTGSHGCRQRSA